MCTGKPRNLRAYLFNTFEIHIILTTLHKRFMTSKVLQEESKKSNVSDYVASTIFGPYFASMSIKARS